KLAVFAFLTFFSIAGNAKSIYWTESVNQKLETLQTFDKNLAMATKLVNAGVSHQCDKVIDDDEMLKINKIYAVKIQKIQSLLNENDSNKQSEYEAEINSIECILN
ncbi:hypothetical protein, partial [Providencia alcalifaciens]|uniref:hypothetical protein n=1 Tax=Providencia alcalifaciens TaxID=126385 RepID=UPI002B05EA67